MMKQVTCRVRSGVTVVGIIVLAIALMGFGQATAQTEGVPASLQDRTEVRFYAESGPVKKGIKEAIDSGLITTQTYEVQPNDTLGKIFAKQGLRPDPNSVEVTNALNNYDLKPNDLVPGQKIKILSRGDSDQAPDYKTWGLMVDPEKKELLDQEFQALKSWKTDISEWASHSEAPSYAVAVNKDYQQILSKLGELRETWYAVDPASLDGMRSGIAEIKWRISGAVRSEQVRSLTETDMKLLAVVRDDVSMQLVYARSYDQALVPVEVVTRKETTGEEVANLSVCYRSALDYRRHKIENPGKEPDWDCLYSFSTLSSPAQSVFKHNVAFAVWAERGGEKISGYHILDIRPNQDDGRCRFELAIYGQ